MKLGAFSISLAIIPSQLRLRLKVSI